jgi:hypothetical protein
MALKGLQFEGTGTTIQVGSMTGAVTSDAAVAVSGVIEIVDTSGSGAYIAFGDSSGVAAPSDEAAGSTIWHYKTIFSTRRYDSFTRN